MAEYLLDNNKLLIKVLNGKNGFDDNEYINLSKSLDLSPLGESPLVLLANKNSKLATKKKITLDELDNLPLFNVSKKSNMHQMIDDYFKKNDENYKMLCRSNDFLFAAQKITSLASNKILELCYEDYSLKRKKYVDLEINIFIEGLVCEYVKYCRNYSSRTLDELYEYTIDWFKTFEEKRLK